MASLQLFLIGAPRAGKSSVFDALTNTPEGPNFATKGGHRIGNVKVPDARLEALRTMYKPKKFTPAEVTFVDVVPPPSAEEKKALSQISAFLSDADAFVLVVQAFGEYDGRGKPLDSAAQVESVALEVIFSDLERVETRLDRIAQDRKRGLKVQESEATVLARFKELLEAGTALRNVELTPDEEKIIASFRFLSRKPLLVVANVSENRLDGSGLEGVQKAATAQGAGLLTFCASLEAEIAGLAPEAQSEFLKDYGISEPARIRLIQSAYRLLDLVSFFTVGEDEVRAWTIRRGTKAQTAAGKIHSDIERGFIRAETVASEELLKTQSWNACRDNATLRLEGKEYEVKDGEVINFRFNA